MLGQLIRSFADMTEGYVPRWAWPVMILVLAAIAWPSVRKNGRTEAARKLFRTAVRLPFAERVAQEDAAVTMVGENPDGLLSLADLALAEGRPRVVPGLVERLVATGKRVEEVRRLQRTLEGPQPATALEAVILVERFLAQGQTEQARLRLDKALARWPDDEDLARLQQETAGR